MRRLLIPIVFLSLLAACSDDDKSSSDSTSESTIDSISSESSSVSLPPTECATTPGPEGHFVRVNVDDIVGGFGGLASRSDADMKPGVVRIEVTGDPENAEPVNVTVMQGDTELAAINGVAAGETCGIDLDLGAGTYRVVEGDRDVEFVIVP